MLNAVVRSRAFATASGRVGLVLVVLVVLTALFGPFFAPGEPAATVGPNYAPPTWDHPLGLDNFGRDVLTRFLWGGRSALGLAVLATLLAYAIGMTVGLAAAYRGGVTDALLMRTNDILLAFPGIVFVLMVVSFFGSSAALLVVAVGVTSAPRTARIARGAALGVVHLPYVEAARARGERFWFILVREVLPNMKSALLVDFGVRFTFSVLVLAGVSFLGLGLQPPAADWGLIISENRGGMTIQPWTVVGPIAALGLLTLGINLIIDAYGGTATRFRRQATVG